MNVYQNIFHAKQKNKKLFSVLIDPDKYNNKELEKIIKACQKAKTDYIFVGGSLLTENIFDNCIKIIRNNCTIPIVIFPGSIIQTNENADAILFLSLISGRNAEMLIGKHVVVAPLLKKTQLEIIPTAYMLIESGKLTSVAYISNTQPIPHDKNDIAMCTAMAGEMLGLKIIFLDAGSGAFNPVSSKMINTVAQAVNIPLIVGGGIKTPEKALENCKAGADLIVVGNAIEKHPILISEVAHAVHSF